MKELAGYPGHHPHNTDEPKVQTGYPEMPKELRATAQREWNRICACLDELGVLTIIDGKALAMYCDGYSDWEEAQRDCIEHGLVVEEPIVSKDGAVVGYKKKPNPAFIVKCMAIKTMKSFLIEFGLTPASRARLKVPVKTQPDALPTRDETKLPEDDLSLDSIDETKIM